VKNLANYITVLNEVSRHEDVSIAYLNTTPWRCTGRVQYSSTHF